MAKEEKAIVKRPIHANSHGLVLRTIEDMFRFAQAVTKSGLAPAGFKTPEQVLIAVQSGAELGMTPMRSLNALCVINGVARLYGDAPLALVRQSGLMESIDEHFDGKDEGFVAVCIVKRKDDPKSITRKFSVDDAITAGLWNKNGPWKFYPKRMLQMRARSLALRDVFPDCFAGATIAEEFMGVDEEQTEPKSKILVDAEQKDESQEPDIPHGDWIPENLDMPGEPGVPQETKPKWRCKDKDHEFAIPKPPNGLCPVCLCKEIEEIKDGDA